MERTQIYLPRTQLLALKAIARKQDTTTSEVVRLFLDMQLQKKKKRITKKTEGLRQAAKRINALGHEAPQDLAKNMDRYLYGNV